MTAEGCDHFQLLWAIGQLMLPETNLLRTIQPRRHHCSLQGVHIPVLLLRHSVRPHQEVIQRKRTKASHCKAGELLELKTSQSIPQPEEVQKNHNSVTSLSKRYGDQPIKLFRMSHAFKTVSNCKLMA